jgi:hypothetical protein
VAFQTLMMALIMASILTLPDFNKPFYIEIDASDVGVGGSVDAESTSYNFCQQITRPKMRGLSTYEKEYVAILLAIEQ